MRISESRTITKAWSVLFLLLTAIALISSSLGCKEDIERAEISGSITVDGLPLNNGHIRFVPINNSKGPSWAAQVYQGQYSTKGSKGAPIGELRVEILGYRPAKGLSSKSDDQDAGEGVPQEQYLPAKYNLESEMAMTIESGSGQVQKNWELMSK